MGFPGSSRLMTELLRFIGTIALYDSFKHMILITVEHLFNCSGKSEAWKIGAAYHAVFSSLRLLIASFYSACLASVS